MSAHFSEYIVGNMHNAFLEKSKKYFYAFLFFFRLLPLGVSTPHYLASSLPNILLCHTILLHRCLSSALTKNILSSTKL